MEINIAEIRKSFEHRVALKKAIIELTIFEIGELENALKLTDEEMNGKFNAKEETK